MWSRAGCVVACLVTAACGRSGLFFNVPLPVPDAGCSLVFAPNPVEFGHVQVDGIATETVTITNTGDADCQISSVAIGQLSQAGFSIATGAGGVTLSPGGSSTASVVFQPTSATPAERTGTMLVLSDDPADPGGRVTLQAEVVACALVAMPSAVDFGVPPIGVLETQNITLFNDGGAPCAITGDDLGAGSDADFATHLDLTPGSAVWPGQSLDVPVTFESANGDPPFLRVGSVVISTGHPPSPQVTVPLRAGIPKCELGAVPPALNFGNILLNASATDSVLLVNDGGRDCTVQGLALEPGTDPDFSLPPSQPRSFVVPPGGQVPVQVTFDDLNGASLPLLHTGTLGFLTGDPVKPDGQVPLQAFVDTVCAPGSELMYTVGQYGAFSRFDPPSRTFTDIGYLNCPSIFPTSDARSSPFSMAVDQNAVAWVVDRGGELFKVSTTDASCEATGFQMSQSGITTFGMSFLFDPNTGLDTLYVDGYEYPFWLATIAFPSLELTPIAPTTLSIGELAGTGDGQLWDFLPLVLLPDGGYAPMLAQLDPHTAQFLSQQYYPQIATQGGFAMKFWGGAFWIFDGPGVYAVDRDTGVLTTEVPNTERPDVVGVGVSTCAPVQQP